MASARFRLVAVSRKATWAPPARCRHAGGGGWGRGRGRQTGETKVLLLLGVVTGRVALRRQGYQTAYALAEAVPSPPPPHLHSAGSKWGMGLKTHLPRWRRCPPPPSAARAATAGVRVGVG
jgi:hypothetical protein